MHKAATALLAIAIVSGTAQAQSEPWANKLFEGTTRHDFGTVPRGAQLKYSFKMKNIYKVPLEITNIRVSCGCLTASPSVKVIQPGDSASLDINMDGTRFTGYKPITIFVTVGPEYISTATLNVTANQRLDVVFNPGEIDFGLVQRGQQPSKAIDIEYAGAQPWAVSEIVKNSASPFELKVEELKGRANRGYRIFATLKTDAPAGPFKHEVILKTNDTTSPTLSFNVLGNVLAALKVSPASINLTAKVGEMSSRKVVVSGSQAFRITAIDGQGEGITAERPDQEASTHIIEIKFQPTKAGDQKRQLTIRTSLDKETATVTIDGSATP
ncbi:MAG: DUF1573 domain-containing protein [Planctomycetes bacterium]|nr:DUF1573 domain-containing protein [Planctomycetota bacterium]